MAVLKFFIAILLLSFINKGLCLCDYNDIVVGSVATGRKFDGLSEWRVTVINYCACPQSEIYLSCNGFTSNKIPNPAFLEKVDDDRCLVKKGNATGALGTVSFTYAGDPPFSFIPLESKILCDVPGLGGVKQSCCINGSPSQLFCCNSIDNV